MFYNATYYQPFAYSYLYLQPYFTDAASNSIQNPLYLSFATFKMTLAQCSLDATDLFDHWNTSFEHLWAHLFSEERGEAFNHVIEVNFLKIVM